MRQAINRETQRLISGAKAGIGPALEQLAEIYGDRIARLVRICMPREHRRKMPTTNFVRDTLRDVLQEIGGYTYCGEGDFVRWMYRATEPAVRRNIEQSGSHDQSASLAEGQTAQASHEDLDRLEFAINRLQPDRREMILMTGVEGLSCDRAARRIGVSTADARNRLIKAWHDLVRFYEDKPAQAPEEKQERLIDVIVEMFIEDSIRGRNPSLEAAVNRHPDFADSITRQINCFKNVDHMLETLTGREAHERIEHDLVGTSLADYDILKPITVGRMGVVFLARQVSLNRRVAIKVIADHVYADAESLEVYRSAMSFLAGFPHENIVRVYDVGLEEGYCYVAMEHVDGISLADILDVIRHNKIGGKASHIFDACLDGDTPVRASGKNLAHIDIDADYIAAVSKVMVNVAKAVGYAHRRGILHRSIEPSNIHLDKDGKPTLLGFSPGEVEAERSAAISAELSGAPRHASPEQIRNAREIDSRSDVFSLGATLYECLTLRHPFEGETANESLAKVLAGEVIPPKMNCRHLPSALNTVILQALEQSPDDRYQTAGEFAEDILNALDRRPLTVKWSALRRRLARAIWQGRYKLFMALTICAAVLALKSALPYLEPLIERILGR